MRIVILGSPDSNKTALATALIRKMNLSNQYPVGNPGDYTEVDRLAVGDMADYRTELHLALLRQLDMQRFDSAVFTGTVLDNYAYALARVYRFAGNEAVSDETLITWAKTAELLALIVRDSFQADKVIFIAQGLEPDSFVLDLQDAIEASLKDFGITFMEIPSDYDLEQITEEICN
jgi:hypothetical protein